jgi:diaminopimelate decarboxylase
MSTSASIPGTDLRPNDGCEIPPFWESDGLVGLLASSDRPFFLYDMRLVERRILRLRERLGPDFQLYYAVKANPNPEILKLLDGWVDGADVSSARELELSLEAGFDPASISFAGPGKTDAELRLAVQKRIGSISIESLNELRRVDRVAGESGETANVSLRINPVRIVKEFAIKMGGKSSQFGIDEEQAGNFFNTLSGCPYCRFVGIHVYSGTQCLNADALAGNFKNTLELVRTAVSEFGAEPNFVNFGGGFGIPYHENQSPLDEASVCNSFRSAFSDFPKSIGRPDLTGILELGRYLIAEAGIYAARIVDVKISRGRTFCVLEGGMNHHLPASGNFGQVIRKNFIIRSLSKPDSAPREEVTLVGPLCTSLDLMGDRILLAKPDIGDWIGFLNSGAYAYTASPLLFLSHEPPLEWMAGPDGRVREIRLPTAGGSGW